MKKTNLKINRALLSVSNKDGIVELAKYLQDKDIEILSTGGTAKHLRKAAIEVIDISDYTGFPEIMDGRVKTLNPKIHGGILGLRDKHSSEADEYNIKWIDLVVCNLYPFADTISKSDTTLDYALDNIDIGGPTMIRSAAKNIDWCCVVVDPIDYSKIIDGIEENGFSFDSRKKFSAKAFGHCAKYDSTIHNYLNDEQFSDTITLSFNKFYDLRYGENPHQNAAAYKNPINFDQSILNATILQGKKLSYNNFMDSDAALACIREFKDPTCVVVKHGNPCGVSTGSNISDVYEKAFHADSKSAFGGIIALNRTCTKSIAEMVSKIFMEIIIAPDFDSEAIDIFFSKKNLRVLKTGDILDRKENAEYRFINGGVLTQDSDITKITKNNLEVVTKIKPTDKQIDDLLFAWKVLKHVKSNAIITAKNNTTLGIGAGQVSRIDSVEIALSKSTKNIENSVLASDAFFPFRDSVDIIADTGVKAIIQPGGSIRDKEVIEACNDHGISMVFTGMRCFKH
jgi:phosphoribosylaminoimidazolecarboxamide formyltransferase/IMP cyclohydrolase